MRLAGLLIAVGLVALAAPGAAARTLTVRPGHSIQAAVDAAHPGDRVLVRPGRYSERGRTCPNNPKDTCAVVIKTDRISLLGPAGKERKVVLKARKGQARGIAVGRTRDEQCLATHAKVVRRSSIANLTVRGFKQDGIRLFCVDRWRISHVRAVADESYGIFPVHTANGRLDHSYAAGAKDTGFYIGQSQDTRVDHNLAERNVDGIEVENSTNVGVDHNTTRDNTGGILVFTLPGLAVKTSLGNTVTDNIVTRNNRKNACAEAGDIVCGVPAGTGVLVLAADGTRVESNRVTGNRTLGIAVANYCVINGLSQEDCQKADIDPDPDHTRIRGNTATGNGKDPQADALPTPAAAADLAWDTTGADNCWSGNVFETTFPDALPACS
jgi:parallel beta-helix repeat protein